MSPTGTLGAITGLERGPASVATACGERERAGQQQDRPGLSRPLLPQGLLAGKLLERRLAASQAAAKRD